MAGQREVLLCRYDYDPLDRVVGYAPLTQESVQRFYRKNRLTTEIQGPKQYSVFEHEEQLLAQQQHQAGKVDSALLATDRQRSVLHAVGVDQRQQLVYSPYGHRSPEGGLISLLGFNGERRDPVTGHYLLGNGYRSFNPVLMRFNSSDSLSPFGKGGVNAYAYCGGDPRNRVDPTGNYFAPALVSGLAHGAFARRVFNIVDNVITRSLTAASRFGRGVRTVGSGAADAVNKLRPSYRAASKGADSYTRVNAERLDSIADFTRTRDHLTDYPPFTATKNHVSTQKSAVSNFVGPRNLENGPTRDFGQLLDNETLAEATMRRVGTDYQAFQGAEVRMNEAIQNWRIETGSGVEDIKRVGELAKKARSVRS